MEYQHYPSIIRIWKNTGFLAIPWQNGVFMKVQEELSVRRREEELLQFTSFSYDDALRLGLLIKDLAEKKGAALAIGIEINGLVIFHFSMTGSNGRNCMWIKRKANMVRVAQVSSLHAMQQREADGKDIVKDWGLDPLEYAAIGGGFPIRLKGIGIIGSVAVSGLPHWEDHQLIVEALAEYLGITEL